jgi:hypothetical protein
MQNSSPINGSANLLNSLRVGSSDMDSVRTSKQGCPLGEDPKGGKDADNPNGPTSCCLPQVISCH